MLILIRFLFSLRAVYVQMTVKKKSVLKIHLASLEFIIAIVVSNVLNGLQKDKSLHFLKFCLRKMLSLTLTSPAEVLTELLKNTVLTRMCLYL